MYSMILKTEFAAAHRLVGYPGVCRHIHGHNWKVEIRVTGESLNDAGMVMDMVELKKIVDEVIHPFDHTEINIVPPFDTVNPTSENMAHYFFNELKRKLPLSMRVAEVTVQESDNFAVKYSEG